MSQTKSEKPNTSRPPERHRKKKDGMTARQHFILNIVEIIANNK